MTTGHRLTAATGIHKGDREYQQDQVAVFTHPRVPGCLLAVLADGMGGYNAGEVASAMATIVAMANRATSLMPHGTYNPFVLRFDAGSLPVGQLVLSSATKTVKDLEDLAYTRIRPLLATVPGAEAPPPFGGNIRSIVLSVDADKLKQVAMHVVASAPQVTSPTDISDEVVAKEKEIQLEIMKQDPKNASKPAEILEKIIDGKMTKFREENALLTQPFVVNPDMKVGDFIGKDAVVKFYRYSI